MSNQAAGANHFERKIGAMSSPIDISQRVLKGSPCFLR
jgi:hypothetical protein